MKWILGVLVAAMLAGCVGDSNDLDGATGLVSEAWPDHPALTWLVEQDPATLPDAWRPATSRAYGLESLALETMVDGVSTGAGFAIWGHYLYIGSYSPPELFVVDIADPTAPCVAATAEFPMRDAAIIPFADGTTILVGASGGNTIAIADVTDPLKPTIIGAFDTKYSNHNLAHVPGTAYVMNAPSGSDATDIWDLTDPTNPIMVGDVAIEGCHDIQFYIAADGSKSRAYCAGYDKTQIWDISDPTAPTVVTEIAFPFADYPAVDPPAMISHSAYVNHDATVLIVGDETGGGAAPACDAYVESPTGDTASGIWGNLWFYDISDETAPDQRGWVSVGGEAMKGVCTSHFGQVIEATNHIAMSFYTAGVTLIDFTDLDNPRIVDRYEDTSFTDVATLPDPNNPTGYLGEGVLGGSWEVQFYQGWLFDSHQQHGLLVLRSD